MVFFSFPSVYSLSRIILGFLLQVAIPVIPTIRVLVTFTKFEELEPLEDDEFSTPPSSPRATSGRENPSNIHPTTGSSWLQWIKTPYHHQISSITSGPRTRVKEIQDPFIIPSDYTWITCEKKKTTTHQKKSKSKNNGRNSDQ